MSKFQKLILLLLSFICMFSIVAAAPNIENIAATISNTIKITIDGKEFVAKDASGKALKPIVYNGSTYLPVRAVAEAAGLKVNYKASLSTIELTTSQKEQESSTLLNIPVKSTEFGRIPTNDWKANTNLKSVADLTFINTNTTGEPAKDKVAIESLKEAIGAIAEGQVSPDSSDVKRFVLDSPDIDRIYEFSKACQVSKLLGLNISMTMKDLEIISVGYDTESYSLIKQKPNVKPDSWQAVVVKGTIVLSTAGKMQTMSGYHILIRDTKVEGALKYYAEITF